MSRLVLDASAVTAVLRGERGHEKVVPHLRGGLISSVNLAEVYCTARMYGSSPDKDEITIRTMQLTVVPFDDQQAKIVASIYKATLGSTVGIADRVCMSLGILHGLPVLTGDHEWLEHEVPLEVRVFRDRRKSP